jgi:hypothetical protein
MDIGASRLVVALWLACFGHSHARHVQHGGFLLSGARGRRRRLHQTLGTQSWTNGTGYRRMIDHTTQAIKTDSGAMFILLLVHLSTALTEQQRWVYLKPMYAKEIAFEARVAG